MQINGKIGEEIGRVPSFLVLAFYCVSKENKRLLVARFPRTNFDTMILNFVLKLVLPKGNTANFSHFYFTFIAKIVFKRLF